MSVLGSIKVKSYLEKVHGEVLGRQLSDGKDRVFQANYRWEEADRGLLHVSRQGSGEVVTLPAEIALDEELIAMFGLYSGDGAKGSEGVGEEGTLRTSISFSQREPNLVKFALRQFKRIFPSARFTFSLGEDSAYFMEGDGYTALQTHYGGHMPHRKPLSEAKPQLNAADRQYLAEVRASQVSVEDDLAFFYQHKPAMEVILREVKSQDLSSAGVALSADDRVTASLRRPYKKGAREPGGSSRSDEMHVGNVTGMGELFLKILHEIEDTIMEDTRTSAQGLVEWIDRPSQIGELVDVNAFFETHPYGSLAGQRPRIVADESAVYLQGIWRASKAVQLSKTLRITPLWCYTSGLYLAEGRSPKHQVMSMHRIRSSGLSLGFTSSETMSLELIIRALQLLFPKEACVETWKVKVGSQYFPELVVVGLKNTVPMLRGGASGDGKLRTMEISLVIKRWALEVAPVMEQYADRYSHVEPTGAGVPRIDFTASSSLCRWYFPLVVYAVFGQSIPDPATGLTHG